MNRGIILNLEECKFITDFAKKMHPDPVRVFMDTTPTGRKSLKVEVVPVTQAKRKKRV